MHDTRTTESAERDQDRPMNEGLKCLVNCHKLTELPGTIKQFI